MTYYVSLAAATNALFNRLLAMAEQAHAEGNSVKARQIRLLMKARFYPFSTLS